MIFKYSILHYLTIIFLSLIARSALHIKYFLLHASKYYHEGLKCQAREKMFRMKTGVINEAMGVSLVKLQIQLFLAIHNSGFRIERF